jgi:ferric-dicitrate binding protein FerR (iron transport regulator)
MLDSENNLVEEALFEGLEVPFKKSKEEVWSQLSSKIDEQADETDIKPKLKVFRPAFAIAASFALIVGVSLFCKLYTRTLVLGNAEQFTYQLPDGSEVMLNSESILSYHPYWWGFDREIEFEGEAFFKVVKGSSFIVRSQIGMTEVLGTSFNILSRNDRYEVYCKTGRVGVYSIESGLMVEIEPNMLVSVKETIEVEKGITDDQIMSWTSNMLNFESENLLLVFKEIERQYDIIIELESELEVEYYTAYFKKPDSVHQAMTLICQSFGLNFEQINNKTYKVFKK